MIQTSGHQFKVWLSVDWEWTIPDRWHEVVISNSGCFDVRFIRGYASDMRFEFHPARMISDIVLDGMPDNDLCAIQPLITLRNGVVIGERDFFDVIETKTDRVLSRGSLQWDEDNFRWRTKPLESWKGIDPCEIDKDSEVFSNLDDDNGYFTHVDVVIIGNELTHVVEGDRVAER